MPVNNNQGELPEIAVVEPEDRERLTRLWNELNPKEQGLIKDLWQLRQDWLDGKIRKGDNEYSSEEQERLTNEIDIKWGFPPEKGLSGRLYEVYHDGRPERRSIHSRSKET